MGASKLGGHTPDCQGVADSGHHTGDGRVASTTSVSVPQESVEFAFPLRVPSLSRLQRKLPQGAPEQGVRQLV
jgi:hypothetical protein